MRPQEMEPEGETHHLNLQLKQVPVTSTGMLIRKPVAEVFEAFVNPNITTKFWFTKSSERLEAGKQVQLGLGNVRHFGPGERESNRTE